ncbi:MAG: hypothetical protein KAS63_00385 [Candidatus Heimdallarchaeota archaeon]|nr:hypothetical protein [Candidatus Heimdallarchaeota archaeon]MCK4953800.1 hypothetical protein [Candidatus Heimdallarchaeota archaeon]
MKHRLMDLLACPVDKEWPLKLEIIEVERESEEVPLPLENTLTKVICNYYCNYKQFTLVNIGEDGSEELKSADEIDKVVNLNDCKDCFQIEIKSGKLQCINKEETHLYNIKDSIPIMLTPEQIEKIYGNR